MEEMAPVLMECGVEQPQLVKVCTYSRYFILADHLYISITAITCPGVPLLVNGVIAYSDTPAPYDFGTMATYTCDTGYGLSGDITRTCDGDGSSPNGVWSGSAPTCNSITCTSLSPITNGRISYSPDATSPFDIETVATYSCIDGFFLSGSDTRTCEGDGASFSGMWSGTAPICSGKKIK